MHERSVVSALLRQVREAASPACPASVGLVELAIGPLSGVDPLLMTEAFDDMKDENGFSNAALSLKETELRGYCNHCQYAFAIERFVFRCPACESSEVQVTSGDELQLLRIHIIENE